MSASIATGTPRVRWPLQPIPGESLHGLLVRVAQENGLGSVYHMTRAAGYHWSQTNSIASVDLDRIPALAHVLRLTPGDLHPMLHVPIADEGHFMVSFGAAAVRPKFVARDSRRVSPASLRRSGHYRLLWNLRVLPFCAESMEHLVNQCPGCGAALTWRRPTPIHGCATCSADLRGYEMPIVAERDREAARLVSNLIDPDENRARDAIARLAPELRDIDRHLLFDLAICLGKCFMPPASIPPNDQSITLTRAEDRAEWTSERVAVGGRLLLGWPEAVERAVYVDPTAATSSISLPFQRFRRLALSQSIPADIRKLMKNTFAITGAGKKPNSKIIEDARRSDGSFYHFFRKKRQLSGLLTAQEASELLGIQRITVETARDSDLLLCPVPSVKGTLLKLEDVERLRERLAMRATYARCEAAFGISGLAIEQLASVGLIEPMQYRFLRILTSEPHVNFESAEAFFTGLLACASAPEADEVTIPLSVAVQSVGGRDKPWVPLFQAILEDRFRVWQPEPGNMLIDRLRVAWRDISAIRRLRFDCTPKPSFSFIDEIGFEAVRSLLNLSNKIARDLMSYGPLTYRPHRRGRGFLRKDVIAFGQRYISIAELRLRLSLSRNEAVCPFMQQHRIRPAVGSHHWLREDVRKLGLDG